MAEREKIATMKRWLLEDVSFFSSQNGRFWKKPIVDTVERIQYHRWPAVYFGGTLRSLLLGRLTVGQPNRPRDIDIVIGGPSIAEVEAEFKTHVIRRTRFGGLHLQRFEWHFDVWPVHETYAFRTGTVQPSTFAELPRTTFFNLEAIAVDVWTRQGVPRKIYSGDDSFFTGMLRQEIEINNQDNPFPELCVIRSFTLAASLRWAIGPNLLQYLAEIGPHLQENDMENIQKKHYGRIEIPAFALSRAIKEVQRAVELTPGVSYQPFLPSQLTFWPEEDTPIQRIHLKMIRLAKRRVIRAGKLE